MRKLLIFVMAAPIVALMFWGCEKSDPKEVIIHDTVYYEFKEFTYKATGTDPNGNLVIFTDPNYPDSLRYELILVNWEYFNEIRVDEFVFFAITDGTSVSLYIDDEIVAESMPFTDEFGDWQFLEMPYNTNKKSEIDMQKMIDLYRAEMKRRGL